MTIVDETEWCTLTSPRRTPTDEPSVAILEGAVLSPFKVGPLRSLQAPVKWTRGAVYDRDGQLVEASQRTGGLGGDRVVAADPQRLSEAMLVSSTSPRKARRLAGRWLYVGNWMRHFGHFLTETLTSLWPADLEVAGLVGHPFVFGGESTDWQEQLITLAGYGGLQRVVAADTTVVEELAVPERVFLPNGYARPQAAEVWRRVADNAGGPAGGSGTVFLSRRAWNEASRAADKPATRSLRNESELDEMMRSRDITVVRPERLEVIEQVRAARGADVIIGPSGSGLHLSAFARSGTKVLEVCDMRSRLNCLPSQRAIDAACGHLTAVVPYEAADEAYDLDRIEATLDRLAI